MPGSTPRIAVALALAAALELLIAAPAAGAGAGTVPMPEATAILTLADDDGRLAIGFAAPLPGVSDRIGLAVVCERAGRSLYATFFFGAFPDGRPVQAFVRDPEGRTARFGSRVQGSRLSGFHDPEVRAQGDVLRLMKMAFARGALLGNGHNAVRNHIPDAANRAARRRLLDCAGVSR